MGVFSNLTVVCHRRKAGDPAGMQDDIKLQLTDRHYTAANNNFPNKFIAFCLSVLFVILLPYLHIGAYNVTCSSSVD